jgi:hypothetical protein
VATGEAAGPMPLSRSPRALSAGPAQDPLPRVGAIAAGRHRGRVPGSPCDATDTRAMRHAKPIKRPLH